MSLKVLAELPIIVVLMYQLYKQHVHNDVAEFIPLIMNTIVLQPTPQQRFHCALLLCPRLRNDLYCVDWDVKLYYTIPLLLCLQLTSRVWGAGIRGLIKGIAVFLQGN